jgi:arylsulfatase A-like enzyme
MDRMRTTLALALVALVGLASSCRKTATTPRHLILVTIDTLRADHLSAYGYARPTTSPAGAERRGSVPGFTIDEIASQGVRFENALAPRGMTLPSMSTLFTGRPPLETCVLDNRNMLPAEVETLAERMKAAGFRTGAFSANRLLAPGSGFEQGFDTFVQDASDDRDARSIAAAEDWIAAQDLEKGPPLFVWIHLVGPHLPYAPAPLSGVNFESLFADPAYRGEADGSREFLDAAYTNGRALDPSELAHVVDLYDGEIARVDQLVSRFLAFCAGMDAHREVRLLDDALLVLAADHGEELSERSRYFGHAKSLYGTVLHVPLVLRCPGLLSAGRVVPDLVELEDVLPTIADLLALPKPKSARGRSLAPLALGRGTLDARAAFGGWRDRMFTVRSDRWRLVWNPENLESDDVPPGPYPVPEVALFDATIDPKELRDVAAEHPDVVRDLEAKIQAWRASLRSCTASGTGPTPEQIRAMKDLGYVGGEVDRPKKN